MPKLSIIIPTFNSADSIERCLHSIGAQVFTDHEVLIQDGASSDRTMGLAKAFQEEHPVLNVKIFSEKDRGPYDAMNRAMRRAAGEWLYFLGSDDELYDKDVLRAVMKGPDVANCDVIYGSVEVVGDSSWAKDHPVYDGIFDLKKFLNRNICHQAIFYRAELLRQVGEYNVNYITCADWDLNMRCWSKTEFKYVDMIVAAFHAGGLSSGGRTDQCFNSELASNTLKYFRLSIYHPLVNTPAFPGFGDIIKMQESEMFLKRMVGRAGTFVRSSLNKLGQPSRG
jgi:glycosyltransferase involved in cell wall biosynthesis